MQSFMQESATSLLMLHGGGAMLTLLLLGALVPLHVQRAWRGRKIGPPALPWWRLTFCSS
jgi:hypothetical protein